MAADGRVDGRSALPRKSRGDLAHTDKDWTLCDAISFAGSTLVTSPEPSPSTTTSAYGRIQVLA
jgi:hypothetical protein